VNLPRRFIGLGVALIVVCADRIAKGENSGNLPPGRPTKYDDDIDLATAKTLDLAVPLILPVRACWAIT